VRKPAPDKTPNQTSYMFSEETSERPQPIRAKNLWGEPQRNHRK